MSALFGKLLVCDGIWLRMMSTLVDAMDVWLNLINKFCPNCGFGEVNKY